MLHSASSFLICERRLILTYTHENRFFSLSEESVFYWALSFLLTLRQSGM